ncbi:hypothetical protein COU91_04145 [Candidatus Saccharibacteria bacterium CG10_big_fil_rev_8_21_14_0_10_47_8]|nr:MAG: hypothetical protein COU91_04145 [Candidatus Saccharibacteria bacterium CG10_big_fil_rev_8_21_14_0_10_47_8]
MNSIDQQFIEYIVKSLVGKPDAVKVERRIDEKGVLLELTVDPEDLGRVIGKRGATAQSLRTLLRALGTKNDARYNLKIVDTGPPPNRSSDSAVSSNDDSASSNSTSNDDSTADEDESETAPQQPAVETEPEPEVESQPEESRSSVVDRTRKELADLDDLDV